MQRKSRDHVLYRAGACGLKIALLMLLFAAPLVAQPPRGRGIQPGTISGRVLSRDGIPAAGVRIAAVEASTRTTESQAMASIAQTDREGRYKLEDVPPGRYLIVAGTLDLPTYFPGVAAEGAARVVSAGPSGSITDVNFALAVAAGLRFSGKVIRQDNTGRTVALVNPAPVAAQPIQIRLVGRNAAQTPVTTVAADGSFNFAQVRPGTYQIQILPNQARMPQLSVTLSDVDIMNYELVVPLMMQVTGVVAVEEGAPAPRFQVAFSSAGSSVLVAGASSVQSTITAQAQAQFSAQVPAGVNRVTVSNLPPGYVLKKITADGVDLNLNALNVTAAGAPTIQIVLSATAAAWTRVTGRVVGRGAPNGTAITASSPQGLQGVPITFFLDGSFEIPRVLPGSYRINVNTQPEVIVPAGAVETGGAIIDMGAAESSDAFPAPGAPSSTTRVTGRIVGRAKAQPGAAVRIVNVETAESRNARIYMDGSFEFAGVQPGQYLAEVFPNLPGAVPATLEVGTRDLRDFQLKVPSTRDIEGKVAVEGAGAAPRSLVFVVASSRVAAPVLPDGSFTVTLPDGLPVALAPDALPNGYEVSAVRYGTLDLLQNPLPAARAGELRVTLKSTGAAAVSGRVSGDPPSPDAVRIWLTDSAGRQRALETTLRPDRTFAFPGVVPGRYNVSLVAAGAYVSKTIDVAAGRDVTDVELTAPRLVRGRIEGGTPLQRFGLQLAGQETEPGVVFIDPQRDGSFNVLLPAGERTIGAATGLPMGLEIDTINYGTTDLRKSPLRVPAAGAVDELKIQLRPIAR